jgi:hypothetical protein
MSVKVDSILPPGWLDVFSTSHPRIAIGLDPATTTKKTSNPSAIVVTQEVNLVKFARLVVRLKTEDPDVITSLLREICVGLRGRGLSVRRLVILATNERFFAVKVRKNFATLAPTELLIESEKIDYLGEAMLVKAYVGNLFVNAIDDGYLALPPAEFVKTDLRLVVRDRGTFDAELGKDGGHGDVFAAGGAALHGLRGKGGKIEAAGTPVGTFGAHVPRAPRKVLNPFAQRFGRDRAGAQLAT